MVLTSGEGATAFALGDVGYISADNTVKLALSNGTIAQASALCICIEAAGVAAGATGRFVFGGRVTGLAGGTAGTLAYLSGVTAGKIVAAPNLTVGQYNEFVGTWIAATVLEFAPGIPTLN